MAIDSDKIIAFHKARAREEIARDLAANYLHTLVHEAKADGLSARETASLLQVSKTTVSRYWSGKSRGRDVPFWGTETEYLDANVAIWSHAPDRAETWCPYQWSDHIDDRGRVARSVELLLPHMSMRPL